MNKALIESVDFWEKNCPIKEALRKAPRERIIEVFKMGVVECVANNYPTDIVLNKYLSKCKGFYYKKQGDVYSDLNVAIFNSKLNLHFKNYEVADVFIRDSKVKVYAKDNSIVMLTAVGDCEIHAEGNVKVLYR